MSNLKRVNLIGAQIGVVWDTGVEPGAGDGIAVKAHTPPPNARDATINSDEFGVTMYDKQELGNYPAVEGSIIRPFYFEGMETFLATMYGLYAGTSLTDGVRHDFELDPVVSGLFQSIAWDEGTEVKTVTSAVLKSMAMSNDNGLDLTFGYMGPRVSIAGAYTTPLGVTQVSDGIEKFKLLQTVVYLNDYDAIDFVDGDKLCVNQFDYVFTRDFQAQPHCAGNAYILEPEEIGVPMWNFTLAFPKKNSVNKDYHGDFQNGSFKKMKVVSTGTLIGGTEYYEFIQYFPKVRISQAPVYSQDSPIPVTLNLEVMKALVVPTGMTKLVPYASLTNDVAALTGYPPIV